MFLYLHAVWTELHFHVIMFLYFQESQALCLPPLQDSIQGRPHQRGARWDLRQDLTLLASRPEEPVLTWKPDRHTAKNQAPKVPHRA